MVYKIINKVALITGGAGGIGLSLAREILCNGGRGVAIADINLEHGTKAQDELEKAFGSNKCIFIKTDVADYNQFEAAFQKTIDRFGNVDILFNNAGVACGKQWEREILVNLKGTVHGMILGFNKYLIQSKQDDEAVIVNTASVVGIEPTGAFPVYSATKSGVLSLVKAWGSPEFYEDSKVRVVGICPGGTETPILHNPPSVIYLGESSERIGRKIMQHTLFQESDFVAKETIKVVKYASNGTSWVIEDNEPAYEYIFPDRKAMKNYILPCQ